MTAKVRQVTGDKAKGGLVWKDWKNLSEHASTSYLNYQPNAHIQVPPKAK